MTVIMHAHVRAALFALLLPACSQSHDEACGGPQPAIEDCERGLYFADCGGNEGSPVIACGDEGCLWFGGGCVAAGYRQPDCPADNICCHPSADGSWPWRDWAPDGAQRIAEDLAVISTHPITRSGPSTVDVSLDSSVMAPAMATYVCEGGVTLSLCGTHEGPLAVAVGESLALRFGARALAGDQVVVEVVLQPDATYVGRAYLTRLRDVGGPGAPLTCETVGDPRWLDGPGTLVLNRFDLASTAGIHGHFQISIDGGLLGAQF